MVTTLIIIGSVLLLLSLISFCLKIRTTRYNIKKLKHEISIIEYGEAMLKRQNLEDVTLHRCNIFSTILFGNTYSRREKKVRISYWTCRRPTVQKLARVASLIGLSELDKNGNKKVASVTLNRYISWLPILFVPLTVSGILIDVFTSNPIEWKMTVILGGIGLGLSLFALLVSLISARTYKLSYDLGYDFIKDLAILTDLEEFKLKRLFIFWKRFVYVEVFYNMLAFLYQGVVLLIQIIWYKLKKDITNTFKSLNSKR